MYSSIASQSDASVTTEAREPLANAETASCAEMSGPNVSKNVAEYSGESDRVAGSVGGDVVGAGGGREHSRSKVCSQAPRLSAESRMGPADRSNSSRAMPSGEPLRTIVCSAPISASEDNRGPGCEAAVVGVAGADAPDASELRTPSGSGPGSAVSGSGSTVSGSGSAAVAERACRRQRRFRLRGPPADHCKCRLRLRQPSGCAARSSAVICSPS